MKMVILLIISSVLLFSKMSKQELSDSIDSEMSLLTNRDGIKGNNQKKEAQKVDIVDYNDDIYYDVATYNTMMRENSIIASSTKSHNGNKATLFSDNNKILEKAKAKEAEKAKADSSVHNITGYCTIRNSIDVYKMQGYGMLSCSFEENELGLEHSDLFATFMPLPKRLALIASPVYISNGLGGKKISISNGVILTIDRTSLNVANYVDDVAIENMTSDIMLQGSDLLFDSVNDYMEQKKLSDTKTEIVTSGTISGAEVTTSVNTEAPVVEDYLITAGLELTSAIINSFGSYYRDSNQPLFKVYANSQFYVDFTVSKSDIEKSIDYRKKDYNNVTINGSGVTK